MATSPAVNSSRDGSGVVSTTKCKLAEVAVPLNKACMDLMFVHSATVPNAL